MGQVFRQIPPDAGCGSLVQVTVRVEPPTGTKAWLVEERPPPGSQAVKVGAAQNGHIGQDGNVSWVSTSGAPAVLEYTVHLPSDTSGPLLPFEGTYRFHGSMDERSVVSGASSLDIRCGSILRILPPEATCGSTIEVGISVAPPPGTSSWLIDEAPPAGLEAANVDPTDSGKWVEDSGTVTWISTHGAGALKTYDLTLPAELPDGTTLEFAGEHRFHPGMTLRGPIGGDQNLTVSCPADGTGEDPTTPPPGTVPTVDDLVPAEPGTPFVSRFLPREATCGGTIFVALGVAPPGDTTSWVVAEVPPEPLVVDHVDPADHGEWVPTVGDIKWVSLSGASSVLVYRLTLPKDLGEGSVFTFNGSARAHPDMAERVPIIGHQNLTISCPASASSGGGGGGGPSLARAGPAPVRMADPGMPPVEVWAARSAPPPGATWNAVTPALSGPAGAQVRIRFAHDAEEVELLFTAGTALEGSRLNITRWPSVPNGTAKLPSGFDPALILNVEIEDGPRKGHTVAFSLRLPDEDLPVRIHAALLGHEEVQWSFAGLGVRETTGNTTRLVASGPCCSLRALGFDLSPPSVQFRVDEGPAQGGLRIESVAVDNVGVAVVALYLDDDLIARLGAPVGTHDLDVTPLTPGNHTFEVMVVDVTGRSAAAALRWVHDPLARAEDPGPVAAPDTSPWTFLLLLLIAIIGAVAVLYTVRYRRPRNVLEAASGSPALSLVASDVDAPEGALMARTFTITGTRGSGANVLLDDPDVPTLALFLGEHLDNVQVEVTKWRTDRPPAEVSPLPNAVPLVLLRVSLPDPTDEQYPVLLTIALAEEAIPDPSFVSLSAFKEGEWQTVDWFRFTLDPDGFYRGSAFAEDRGWLLVASRRPEDMDPMRD